MEKKQIIGTGILGAVVVGWALTFAFTPAEPEKKVTSQVQPRILMQKEQTTPTEWKTFVCSQGQEVLNYFDKAKAEFVERKRGTVTWRVMTPERDTVESAIIIKINPNQAVCGYLNK